MASSDCSQYSTLFKMLQFSAVSKLISKLMTLLLQVLQFFWGLTLQRSQHVKDWRHEKGKNITKDTRRYLNDIYQKSFLLLSINWDKVFRNGPSKI